MELDRGELAIIIVAAGSGSRFGSDLPKQFCRWRGRPLLMTTIERLRRAAPVSEILLVISPGMEEFWLEECERHGFDSPRIAYGGATRTESVLNALAQVSPARYTAVHDGARPMIDEAILAALVVALRAGAEGAIPVVGVTDSLRRLGAEGTSQAVNRADYVAVQTPQMFRTELLQEAYSHPLDGAFTDDASVVEAFLPSARIVLTPGSPRNIKVTHPGDLRLLEE